MGNFPYVEIEGTPFEIGFQHGELFKDKILNSIQCYKEMFMDYSNLEWSRAKKLSTRFVEVIRDYNPDYLEEIRGVAEVPKTHVHWRNEVLCSLCSAN